MSDCCSLSITLRREDLYRFGKAAGKGDAPWWDEESEGPVPHLVDVGVESAGEAWQTERQAAADAGIPFVGCHGRGWDYGSAEFVSADGVMLDAEAEDGCFMLRANRDLNVVDDMAALRRFVELEEKAKRKLGIAKKEE